jgi:outer membrane protein assembly factor BamB
MTRTSVVMAAAVVAAIAGTTAGTAARAEWPQWRGPDRTGADPSGPALAEAWPAGGPPLLWQSEEIPSGGGGGYSSPVVAGGRVYLFVNWRYEVSIDKPVLKEKALRDLGWSPEALPPDLAAEVEKARTGQERAKVTGEQLAAWTDAWIAQHVPPEQQKALGPVVRDRLRRGPSALPLEVLAKLAAVKDKPFEGKDQLQAWLAANGFAGEALKDVSKAIPVATPHANDVVVCLSAADGKTLWKATFPGRPQANNAAATACVAGGRVYAVGSTGGVYCLRADTGEQVWATQAGSGASNASPVVADGACVVSIGNLMALDAQTGTILWQQPKVKTGHTSPTIWRAGGTGYVLARSGGGLACVGLKTGDLRWTVPCGDGESSPVASDSTAVVITNKEETGLLAFRLTPDGAERLWTFAATVRGVTPVLHENHVYALAERRAVCLELRSGKVCWDEPVANQTWSSPALVDGKLVAALGRNVEVFRASPQGLAPLAKASLGLAPCTSLAVADGRLFLRQSNAVACYDLRPGGK